MIREDIIPYSGGYQILTCCGHTKECNERKDVEFKCPKCGNFYEYFLTDKAPPRYVFVVENMEREGTYHVEEEGLLECILKQVSHGHKVTVHRRKLYEKY